MATHKRQELNREQLKQIAGLARTLHETSEELYTLAARRHPELQQVTWLINQTNTRVKEIMKILGQDF